MRADATGWSLWTTTLGGGKSRGGVTVSLHHGGKKLVETTSDKDGWARLRAQGKARPLTSTVTFVANAGRESVFLRFAPRAATGPGAFSAARGRYKGRVSARGRVGMIFAERGIYRPGEKVHIKAYVRGRERPKRVRFVLRDPANRVVLDGQVALTPFGSAYRRLRLPKHGRLGDYRLELFAANERLAQSSIKVVEFRPPQFSVRAWLSVGAGKAKTPLLAKPTPVIARVGARYFFGAPVAKGDFVLAVLRQSTAFRSPRHPGFVRCAGGAS